MHIVYTYISYTRTYLIHVHSLLALYSLKQQTRLLNMITQWQRTENITKDNIKLWNAQEMYMYVRLQNTCCPNKSSWENKLELTTASKNKMSYRKRLNKSLRLYMEDRTEVQKHMTGGQIVVVMSVRQSWHCKTMCLILCLIHSDPGVISIQQLVRYVLQYNWSEQCSISKSQFIYSV